MSENQHAQRPVEQAPARKAESSFTPAQQLYIAKKIAKKSSVARSAMADSIEQGGAGAGEGMAKNAEASRTPSDIAAAGFSGAGQEIPHRKEMEESFGQDFGHVRAYTDGNAAQASKDLGAHAYAVDNQIAFGSSNPDKATVAHELTHTMQHTGMGPARKATGADANGIDTAGEGEAEAVEAAVSAGKPARSVWEGEGGGGAAKGTGQAGPARKSSGGRPALDSRFAMGMTFSTEAFEKSYEYMLWSAKPPIEIPIPAVPGLNFLVEPQVKVKAAGGANWKEKNLQAAVGVDGGVGIGFSYGKSEVAAVYGVMEGKASGGFEYKKSDKSWELAGGIGISTNFKVGVRLAGGILDYGFEFGKCEIGKLTGLYWKDGKFAKEKLGGEWGDKPKEFFAAMRAAVDKAKRLMSAGAEVAKQTWNTAKATGAQVYRGGREAMNWVTSW